MSPQPLKKQMMTLICTPCSVWNWLLNRSKRGVNASVEVDMKRIKILEKMKQELCLHEERVKYIRQETSRELDFPPYPPAVTGSPSESSGKRSDVATFVTDLILKYDVLEYLETVEPDESSTIRETWYDVAMYSLSSSGSDS